MLAAVVPICSLASVPDASDCTKQRDGGDAHVR
jgi:hypothetical protein